MESVDLIASGYEWCCPECEHLNKVIEYKEIVECTVCKKSFSSNYPEHAIG
jgi:uncharacterized CHY-type Zn-finger protein